MLGWSSVNICWVLQRIMWSLDDYQWRASSFCLFAVYGFKFCTPRVVWASVDLRGSLETDPGWKLMHSFLLDDAVCKNQGTQGSLGPPNAHWWFPAVCRLCSHRGQPRTGREDVTAGQSRPIAHPSASDERCKWKPPSWRYNQTPSTHVNVDCQNSQPFHSREPDRRD